MGGEDIVFLCRFLAGDEICLFCLSLNQMQSACSVFIPSFGREARVDRSVKPIVAGAELKLIGRARAGISCSYRVTSVVGEASSVVEMVVLIRWVILGTDETILVVVDRNEIEERRV
jgi:hypothetical protein